MFCDYFHIARDCDAIYEDAIDKLHRQLYSNASQKYELESLLDLVKIRYECMHEIIQGKRTEPYDASKFESFEELVKINKPYV